MFTAEGTQRRCRIVGTSEFDYVEAAVADGTGVYIAGHTWGTLADQTKTGVFHDGFIMKYDSAGNAVWTRQFGSPDLTRAESIASDGVALHVAGTVRGSLAGQMPAGDTDIFLRSYDMSGNLLWTRQFGSATSDSPARVGVSQGRVYVAGLTTSSLPGQVSLGSTDVFVRAYDPSGIELWTRQFGTFTSDSIGGVAADAAGVYVAGHTFGTLPGQTSQGIQDAYLRRYDASGDEQWTRQFGNDLFDNANGVGVDSSGVYVAGRREVPLIGTATIDDAVLWKVPTPRVLEVWRHQFGGTGHGVDFAESVAVRQGVYVAGRASLDLPGQARVGGSGDAFVRKYDQGTELWTRQFGTTNHEDAMGVAADDTGVYASATRSEPSRARSALLVDPMPSSGSTTTRVRNCGHGNMA